MSISVKFTANENVASDLQEVIDKAIDAGADKMVEVSSGLAPRDTGTLADSIHKERGKGGQVFVIADPKQDRAPNGYALYVEQGTFRTKAQPFMMPGLKAAIPTITSQLG